MEISMLPPKLKKIYVNDRILNNGGVIPCKCGGYLKKIDEGVVLCERCGNGCISRMINKNN